MGQGISADLARAVRGGHSAFGGGQDNRGFIDGDPDLEMLQEVHEDQLRNYEANKDIAALFSSDLGRKVLQFFKNRSLNCIQFDPNSPNPEQNGFFRSGEANFVLVILNAIRKAEDGPPQPPPELLQDGEGELDE